MEERAVKLAIGSLLHDIGKILYRYNDGRNHSASGYDFLKEQGIDDSEILDQVRYHHGKYLSGADIPEDSLAYITYWADNVAAGSDRKDDDSEENDKPSFDKFVPLASIFNYLNDNNGNMSYSMETLNDDGKINMPTSSASAPDEEIYGIIVQKIRKNFRAIQASEYYVNSLLNILESNLTYVPSSTDTSQIVDISLYDHVKITAAVAGCAYEWIKEQGTTNYKETFFANGNKTYDKKVFLMYGLDTSGIQDFIYKVDSEGTLKMLRAKSFYLELLLQNIVDDLLERIGLSRANLIYTGGGHAYLLLPNTEECKIKLEAFESELKSWILDNFSTDLYIAHGYSECSANELMNKPEGSYQDVFRRVTKEISINKTRRYSAADIIKLNSRIPEQSERECRVCGSTDRLTEDNLCELCDSLINLSSSILNEDFITILSERQEKNPVKLPFGRYMLLESKDNLRKRIEKNDKSYVRSYSKNKPFTGIKMNTCLWVGDYNNGSTFAELADSSRGIHRLGVLRADVDNLGQTFVNGFNRNNGRSIASLTRNACLSRKLSIFFKLHINYILGHGEFHLTPDEDGQSERNALIVYSGGDDMFIVGAWNDILEAAVDIERKFKEFTQNTLSISGGFSIFREKYPVRAMADNTGMLEDFAKELEGKDAITLFTADNNRYKWDDFTEKVVGEKFKTITSYFELLPEKGMSAIYKLMAYVRAVEEDNEEQINIARFAYQLGRMAPSGNAPKEKIELYHAFSKSLYKWIKSDEDRKELLTAIYIYVYLNRNDRGSNYE